LALCVVYRLLTILVGLPGALVRPGGGAGQSGLSAALMPGARQPAAIDGQITHAS
jgi:hypothetical protein